VSSRQPWLLFIFLVALILRLGFISTRDDALTWPDERDYDAIARSLLNEGRIEEADGRRASRAPGYPLFLAGLYSLGFDDPRFVFAAQAALGALTCVLIALLGREFSRGAGVLAGFISAGYPFFVYFTGLLLSETLFTLGLVGFFLGLQRLNAESSAPEWKRLGSAAALGCLAGILIHIRSAFLLCPVWILPFLLVRFRPRARVLCRWTVMVFIAGLALSPWVWRNYRLFGRFVPTTLQMGESLYEANSPFADGGPAMDRIPWEKVGGGRFLARAGEDESERLRREYERDRFFRGEAWRFIRQNPERFARLAVTKLKRFWNVVPNYEPYRAMPYMLISLVGYTPVMILAVAGLIAERRRPGSIAYILSPVLYFTGLHMLFVGSIRYRVPTMPFVILLSGSGGVWLWGRLRRREGRTRWLRLGYCLLALLVLGAAGGIWSYRRMTDPERLRLLAQERLSKAAGRPVRVGRARFELRDGLILEGLRVRAGETEPQTNVLDVGRLLLAPDWREFLRTRSLRWRSIELEDVDLRVHFDETGRWRFFKRIRQLTGAAAGAGRPAPTLHVTRARVRVAGLRTSPGLMPPFDIKYVNGVVSPVGEGRELQGRVWSEDRGLGRPSVAFRVKPGGRVEGEFSIVNFVLDTGRRALLPDALKRKWDSFTPIAGQFDCQGEFAWEKRSNHPLRVEADIFLRDGRFNHPLLSDEVSNLSAEIHLENLAFRVRRFRALLGGAVVSGSATGRVSRDMELTGHLGIRAEGLRPSKGWSRLLPASFRATWEQLAPSGTINVTGTVSRERPDAAPEAFVRADLLDCSCRPPGWSVPLTDIRGELEYSGGRLQLRGITGRAGRGRFAIDDSVVPADPRETFAIKGEIRDLAMTGPVTEFLPGPVLPTLPSEVRASMEGVSFAGGRADIFVSAHRLEYGAQPDYRLEVVLKDVGLNHPRLKDPVSSLRGRLVATNGAITVSPLAGRWSGGELEVPPFRWDPSGRSRRKLIVRVRNLTLGESFYRNLPASFRSALKAYDAEGKLDLELALEPPAGPGQPSSVNTVARVRDARITYSGFPYPVASVSGELHFASGHLERAEFRGKNKAARVYVGITSPLFGDKPGRMITVRGDEGAWDADLRNALPEAYRALWDRIHPRGGRLNVLYVKHFQRVPWRADLFRISAEVNFEGTTVDVGAPAMISKGRVVVAECRPESGDGTVSNGTFSLDGVNVRDVELTDINGVFESGAGGVRIRNVSGRCYGGSLSGSVELSAVAKDAQKPLTLHGVFSLAGADAEAVARLYGIKGITGRLDAHCTVSGEIGEQVSFDGAGTLTVRDGKIGHLPGTLSVLNLVRLQALRAPAFHTLELAYAIEKGRIHVSSLNLLGDVLSLYGRGVVRDDGRLHFRFRPEFVGESRLLGVDRLIDALKETVMPITLEGEPRKVVWKLGWLTPLDRAFRALPMAVDFLRRRALPRQGPRGVRDSTKGEE